MTIVGFYLYSVGMFLLGWLCCCLVTFGHRARDEWEDDLAVMLMDKQAAQDAARVKDLELQRVRS